MYAGRMRPETNAVCPNCGKEATFRKHLDGADSELTLAQNLKYDDGWFYSLTLVVASCRLCDQITVSVWEFPHEHSFARRRPKKFVATLLPIGMQRNPPAEVTDQQIIDAYHEATAVAAISPRSALVLCRYIGELVLRGEGYEGRNLDTRISAAEKADKLSPTVLESLDILRHLGGYLGAHPGDNYSEVSEATEDDAAKAIALIDLIFEAVYVARQRMKVVRERAEQAVGQPLTSRPSGRLLKAK